MSGHAGFENHSDWRAPAIADHAMISDGETGALVCRDGTIDWLCMPHFDSEPCLAALLGSGDNGAWWLAPKDAVRSIRRRYRDDSAILETDFETDRGRVRVIDFMPAARGEAPDIVRIVRGLAGEVEMSTCLALRFAEGQIHPLRSFEDGARRGVAIAGPNAVALDFSVPLHNANGCEHCEFTVLEGAQEHFILTWYPSHQDRPEPVEPFAALEETDETWREWAARCRYEGEHREMVVRSLITLKGLVHWQTGGMLAALTSSLPESLGGSRNWDYRYCWLRDATFALLALLRSGYRDEACSWIAWLRRALAGEPIDVRPFYRIDGRRLTTEREASWLSGFGGAQPVRFGNAASGQLQLDIYGEAIDALFVAFCEGLCDERPLVKLLAAEVEKRWREPDDGIWESRGAQQHYVYSKGMCWVALDRAARLAAESGDRKEADRLREIAREVREDVFEKGFHETAGAFTQTYDTLDLDASVLRLPLVGFIDARDPRMISTVAAIENVLMRDGLVWRYEANGSDGLSGEEGSFIACSSWLVDVYAAQGRLDEARALFGRICGAANDLGLLSEEFLPDENTMVGNFPQALSHVALINNAFTLSSGGQAPRIDAFS